MSKRPPRKRTPAASARARSSALERVALLVVGVADDREAQLRDVLAQQPRPLEHLEVALLAHEPPDEPDHDVVGRARAELGARGARVVGVDASPDRSGVRSMPLPSSVSLRRGTPRRASVSRSSGFCTSSACENSPATRSIA